MYFLVKHENQFVKQQHNSRTTKRKNTMKENADSHKVLLKEGYCGYGSMASLYYYFMHTRVSIIRLQSRLLSSKLRELMEISDASIKWYRSNNRGWKITVKSVIESTIWVIE